MRWQVNHFWPRCTFVFVAMLLAVSGKVLRLICLCRYYEKRHSTRSSFEGQSLKRLDQRWRSWRRSTMELSSLSVKGPYLALHFTQRLQETHVFITTFSA